MTPNKTLHLQSFGFSPKKHLGLTKVCLAGEPGVFIDSSGKGLFNPIGFTQGNEARKKKLSELTMAGPA